MGKYKNEEAQYERMRNLAKIDEGKSQNNTKLGTLIDFKRGADNVAYGIVKENHNYHIKKSNKQSDPNVEDFAYIGGLQNITEHRYKKLSDAEKNRNMLLITINEALGGSDNVISEKSENGEKQMISEATDEKKAKKDDSSEKEKTESDNGKKEDNKKSKKDKEVESKGDDKKSNKKEKVDENAEEELDAAEEKLDSAETATEEIPDEEPNQEDPDAEINVDNIDLPPEGGEEGPAEEPSSEEIPSGDDSEMNGGEETPEPEASSEENPDAVDLDIDVETPSGDEEGEVDENNREIQKMVGKVTNLVRNTEMTPSQVQSYVNSFLTAFEHKFPELEVEERKEMAEKITKVVDGEEELEASGIEESDKLCEECGFAKYAESMGYGDAGSLVECGDDEAANLMSGYAMENDGAVPDEDLASMAAISNSDVMESLVNEYGHSELAESLKPYNEQINEENSDPEAKKKNIEGMFWWKIKPQEKKDTELKTLSEEEISKYGEMSDDELSQLDDETLNELNLAGLKNVGSYLGKKTGDKIKGAGQAIKGAITSKIDQATEKLDQIGNDITQQYQKGVKSTVEEKLQKAAKEFGELIAKLDAASQKAGEGPINKQSLIMSLQSVLKGGGVSEMKGQTDTLNTQVQPMMEDENEEEIETSDLDNIDDIGGGEEEPELTPGFETMGVDVPKPDGPEATTVDITKDNVQVTLSEQKLRKYIRNRLEEKAGRKKPVLNENEKSPKLKKLDKMIDSQYEMAQSVIKENKNLNEIFGFSNKEKFEKIDPNNEESVNAAFNEIFRNALRSGARKQHADKMPTEVKYDLMKQGVEQDGLKNPSFTIEGGKYVYKPFKAQSKFTSGGTQGKTGQGGV